MKSNWKTCFLGDVVDFNPKETLPKGTMAKKIGMDKLQPFCRDIPGYEIEAFSGGTKFRNNDTIMARITPCLENGKTAKVSILDENEIGFGSTEYIVFRSKEGITDPDFVYYLVCSSIVREPAIKSMVGSSGRQRVQTDVVEKLEIEMPSLSEQKKIASILKSIDDKIFQNNEINKNLEDQALAIFKNLLITNDGQASQFGVIPNYFTSCKVGDIPMLVTDYVANGSFASLKENVTLYQEKNYAYFIRNTDLKADSFSVFVDEHSYNFLSKSTLYGNEVIISNVGDVGSVFLCPTLDQPMTLGNNIIMLRPNNPDLNYYLYIWFKYSYGQDLIQGIKGGSAQPKFNKTDFKNTAIILPDEMHLKEFALLVTPIFELITANKSENKQLSALRDTLLPQLMSGEIDVSSIAF